MCELCRIKGLLTRFIVSGVGYYSENLFQPPILGLYSLSLSTHNDGFRQLIHIECHPVLSVISASFSVLSDDPERTPTVAVASDPGPTTNKARLCLANLLGGLVKGGK